MDKQIADQIITEYFKKIYGFAMKKAFSYDEAEELCADILHEVYVSLLKAEDVYNIEGYIWRISEHAYSKFVSSKKKHEGISIDGMEIPYYEDFLIDDAEEEIIRLRREVAFLTEKRRRIVYLFYYEDKPISYISKKMGMPEGTVKWHLNKARNELKEGFSMERKIGKLGLDPITAVGYGHSGHTGENSGPEYYLGDKLNLNIVYSVYFEPKTAEEIAEELGVTLVFIEDRIALLEGNGFLVKTKGDKFTTYVSFEPGTFSLEREDVILKKKQEIAQMLVEEYVPLVRKAVAEIDDVYIPGGNRELLEALAVSYGVTCTGGIKTGKNLSKYEIKTTAGGKFIAYIELPTTQSDPDYKATLANNNYRACGWMIRGSDKYPVESISIDTKYCSREGAWENNEVADYEYLYELISGTLDDNAANAEKFARLREKRFITDDNRANIMIARGGMEEFLGKIPSVSEELKKKFADYALEYAMLEAKDYPLQMQDLVIANYCGGFIGTVVAVMVLDILYGNGTWKTLTENEKVTSLLVMFSDILPQ
ncbi:MAG: sigma-70 family RNA polymerase sigma factor [Ruminococcaceae bacterium]|nr:sigma-70 family RNA polymerase sigma factor [Oscillospiraceae bacterium]